ncbi:MAG: YbjP/YqhG family protein [Anaerolineae bacterium]|nr:YbjP/YqhG family protein [Anaerolineae bacterium]
MAKRLSALIAGLVLVAAVGLGGDVPASSGQAQNSEAAPEAVVEAFYTWYLNYIGSGEDFRNPLVDRAYRASDLLSADFIAEMDEYFESVEFIPGDPFLCAQDVPQSFAVEEARMLDEEAEVVVRTSFEGHALTVLLSQEAEDAPWLIADIRCGEVRTPEGVVKSFYNWYIGYNQWEGQGDKPHALMDGAYRENPLLAEAFVAELDEMVASPEGLWADPILCAQDIPWYVRVEEVQVAESGEEAEALLSSSFEGHSFAVQLLLVDEQWQIAGIACR